MEASLEPEKDARDDARPPVRRLDRVLGLVFGLWLVVVLVGGSSLMASHLVALPTPEAVDPHVAAEIARDGSGWRAVHVLAARCACSRRVLDHLARRGPVGGVHERILWVAGGEHAPPAIDGFVVDIVSSRELGDRLGVIGAPTLIVASPEGRVVYVGGYTRQKQSPFVADVDVLARLRRGERVAPLPVLGCALDEKTARRLDPLGIR